MKWWTRIPVGTRSLLVGAHAFWLHPWFVAFAWWKLYEFRVVECPSSGVRTSLFDPRLWVCFIVHDIGYWKSPNMDGPEGELHPKLGAWIAHWLLDWGRMGRWCHFVLYHSRFLSKRDGIRPSLLCHAVKAAIWLTPSWLYIPMARLSGEIKEYRDRGTRPENSYGWDQARTVRDTDWQWHRKVRVWAKSYAMEHRDGRADTWTAA